MNYITLSILFLILGLIGAGVMIFGLVMDGKKVMVNSYHGQTIRQLGKGMVATAIHELDNTIEAFQHEHLPIYGIVWHPERMGVAVVPEAVANLLK